MAADRPASWAKLASDVAYRVQVGLLAECGIQIRRSPSELAMTGSRHPRKWCSVSSGWRSLIRRLCIVPMLKSSARTSGGTYISMDHWHLCVIGEGPEDVERVALRIPPLRRGVKQRIENDYGIDLPEIRPLYIAWERRSSSLSGLLSEWQIECPTATEGGIYYPQARLIIVAPEGGERDFWDMLAHEMTHAFLLSASRGAPPHFWAQEGYATYISSQFGLDPENHVRNWARRVRQWRPDFQPTIKLLCDDRDYEEVEGLDRSVQLASAFIVVSYLRSRPEHSKAWRMFSAAALGVEESTCDLSRIPATLGMTVDEFDGELRAYVEKL